MRKTMVTMVITLAFVALAYYGRESLFDSAPDQSSHGQVTRSDPVKRLDAQRELPPNPFTSTRGNTGVTHNVTPGETAVVTHRAQPSVNDPTDVTNETRDDPRHRPNTEVASASVDQTVVGRPFPVSASVMRTCRESDAKWVRERRPGTAAHGCAGLDRLLPKFAEEPRDAAWADQMEQTLRDIVVNDGRPFEIRALECRTSICAIEAASRHGDLAPQTPYQVDLRDEERMYGYERTPSGQHIKVTLSVYTRW